LKLYPEEVPQLFVVGHSMGGAIAVHFAHMSLVPNLIGITVIDVVEGTAMEALASMQSFLRSRPKYFQSIPNAIVFLHLIIMLKLNFELSVARQWHCQEKLLKWWLAETPT